MKRRSKPHGYIVAIDGPSGAGKSTVSKLLARALKGVLIDTGVMYRAVALHAIEAGLDRPACWSALSRRLHFAINLKDNALNVDGIDLGDRLRREEVGNLASSISQYPSVRAVLTQRQRRLARGVAKSAPVVMEGRDIGTVVFPMAPFKFYVTADPKTRAKRRFQQLQLKGIKGITLSAVLRDITRRDRQDSNRRVAPLRCAVDAVVVDTSKMPISQVVLFLKTHIESKVGIELRD